MRVTKDIASLVAKKLVDERKQAIKKTEDDFTLEVFEAVKAKIPKKIIESFYYKKGYFRTSSTARLIGSGFNHESVYFEKSLPCKEYQHLYEPSDLEGEKWIKIWNAINTEKIEIDKLQRDIENALYNLKTYNAVRDNFPEAFELLPEKQNTAISINISDIRNRIK